MEFSILGPLEVRTDGRVIPIPGAKERALLGLLLVEAGTVVSTDRMIYELWGDDAPPTALRTLRSHVSRLRRSLPEPERLITRRPGYSLEVARDSIDAAVFERLADRARRELDQDARSAADGAAAALRLWKGRALDDLLGFEFAEREALRLEERRVSATELRLDADLRLGHHDLVLSELRALVGEHPFYERFWAQLMLALYRAGRAGEAVRVFEEARRVLGESLGIEPSMDLRMLERSIVLEDPALDLPGGLPPHNLPARSSSFVGREQELAALDETLTRSRSVTMIGPGGSGKSRLAVEAAGRMLGRFPAGVWRVELAALRRADEIPVAVSAALGEPASHAVDPTESLLSYLGDREALLLIDNCEHLLDGCAALVTAVLQRCPRTRVLATSREALRVEGEVTWIVQPLQLPGLLAAAAEQEAAEAFRLFVERSMEAEPAFVVDEQNRADITRVCRALAGLPLAIELAARRSRALTPAQLATRLGEGIDVLKGGRRSDLERHQTMRGAIDWSYGLLNHDEQDLFRSLAVFTGGWTLEAMQAVSFADEAESGRVVDQIANLVDKSLVERLDAAGVRYRMLEPIGEYGRELLEASGEAEEIRARHAAWFLALAQRGDGEIRGEDQAPWLNGLDADHDNLRAALRWCIDTGRHAIALNLVAAMGWYWFMRGHWREAWQWLETTLRAAGDAHTPEAARAIYKTGALEVIRRNDEPALTMIRSTLDDCRDSGDREGEAWCLHLIAHSQLGKPSREILEMLDHSHAIFEELGREWEIAWSNRYRGDSLIDTDLKRAVELQLASISAFRELGDVWSTAYGLHNLANLYLSSVGRPGQARPYYERCLRLATEIGDPVWTAHGLLGVGVCAVLSAEPEAGPLLEDAVERLRLIGDDNCLISAVGWVGVIRERDQSDEAAACYAEAARVSHKLRKKSGMAISLDRIARLALRSGRASSAVRLAGAVQTAIAGIPLAPHYLAEHRALVEEIGESELPAGGEDIEELVPYALEVAAELAEQG